MSLSLATMRTLVRKGLGDLTATDMDNTECDRLLNMSLWALWQQHNYKERECRIYTETVDGTSDYGLPEDATLDSIISVAIKDGVQATEGKYTKLVLSTWDRYDEEHSTLETARGKPVNYHRLQHTLILDPVPDDVYTIRIVFWRTIVTLVDTTYENTQLPANWDEIVVEGAISRGHFYNEDYNEANAAQNFQKTHLRDAVLIRDKELRDGRYAGLRVLRSDPEAQ